VWAKLPEIKLDDDDDDAAQVQSQEQEMTETLHKTAV